jgi:5-methylcytosine-specific restriction endonuclease McrA
MPGIPSKKRYKIRRRLKAKALRALWFSDKRCAVCGSRSNLELDHVIPQPHLANWRIWMRSAPSREAELAKCQPLCRPCHKAKSAREGTLLDHGLNRYERHGCRCPICRAASALKKRNQRARAHLQKITSHNMGLPDVIG